MTIYIPFFFFFFFLSKEAFKTGENMDGAAQKFDKVTKFALLNVVNVPFIKLKEKISKYCHNELKMQPT